MKPLVLLMLLFVVGACKEKPAATPPKPIPPTKGPDWKAAFSYDVKYDATKKAVHVTIDVAPGFHAYTVGETIGKPLRVTIDEASAYAHAGDVQYPKGEEKNLPIGKSVIVEGKAEVLAPISKREGVQGGQASGKFRYQVCTDESCDRPRTEPFALNVPE